MTVRNAWSEKNTKSIILFYEYDELGRIERKIEVNLEHNLKDTTTYTYYQPGENNFEGASYKTRSPGRMINPDGSVTRYLDIYKTYYFSPSIKLKSWITYPYNYGRIFDAPMVRYVYTTEIGNTRTESSTHTLDEQGLIIKTVQNYPGGSREETYSYVKK